MEISKVKLGSGGCGSVWLGRVGGVVCAVKKTTVRRAGSTNVSQSPSPARGVPSKDAPLKEDQTPNEKQNRLKDVMKYYDPSTPCTLDESSEGAILQSIGPRPCIIPCPCPPAACGDTEYVALALMDSDLAKEIFQLRNHVRDLSTFKYIADCLFSALSASHRAGYAHRDVKPANLLLQRSPDGFQLYLSDFGSAHGLSEDVRRSSLELKVRGTCRYQAPEQIWQGQLKASSAPACDIWAAGCSLFEIATGTPLFKGERGVEILHQIFSMLGTSYADFPKQTKEYNLKSHIQSSAPWLPEVAVNLIESCLRLVPQDRGTVPSLLNHAFFKLEVAGQGSTWTVKNPEREMEKNLSSTKFQSVSSLLLSGSGACLESTSSRSVSMVGHNSSGSIHWSQQRRSNEETVSKQRQRAGTGLFDNSASFNTSSENTSLIESSFSHANGHRVTLGNLRTTNLFADLSTTRGKQARDEGEEAAPEGRPTVPFNVASTSGDSPPTAGLQRHGTQQYLGSPDARGSKSLMKHSPVAHKKLCFDSPDRVNEAVEGMDMNTAIIF